jgi:hypothetical protein
MEHARSSGALQRREIAPREEREKLAYSDESKLPSCVEQAVEVEALHREVAQLEEAPHGREEPQTE